MAATVSGMGPVVMPFSIARLFIWVRATASKLSGDPEWPGIVMCSFFLITSYLTVMPYWSSM